MMLRIKYNGRSGWLKDHYDAEKFEIWKDLNPDMQVIVMIWRNRNREWIYTQCRIGDVELC
jgi:hypothetical protein